MPTSFTDADFLKILGDAKETGGTAVPFPTPAAPFMTPYPSPIDWRDQWIYFLLLDRFNGPKPPVQAFDGSFAGFQGGTFLGVRRQLEYLKNLGVGTIWLSPALENLPFRATYHGYGIHDFLRAERRFAETPAKADDELRQLVDEAHRQGMFVVFDIVLNHTGDVFAYDGLGDTAPHSQSELSVHWRDQTGTPGATNIETVGSPSRDALVWPKELQKQRFYRREGVAVAEDVVGDFSSLKQFRTDFGDLQSFLILAYQYVIARFDCDGFRIDTLRYLQGDLPRLFGNAMREFALSIGKRNFFTFGEVFDSKSEDDIARFIGRNTSLEAGDDDSQLVGVDAALDYPLYSNLKTVLKGWSAPQALVDMYQNRKNIERPIVSSHGDATRFFVTFLDNHDNKARFYFVDPSDPHALDDQLTAAVACLFALPGIPCLYYGTEQGLHGVGSADEDVREALWGKPGVPFDPTHPFYVSIAKLARVRAQQPAMRYGRLYFRPISGDNLSFAVSTSTPGVAAFGRILNDTEVLVAVNTSNGTVPVSAIIDGVLHADGTKLGILYSNRSTPTAPGAAFTVGKGTPVSIREVDGSLSGGPARAVRLTLGPREVQILA
jgi:glycosidase